MTTEEQNTSICPAQLIELHQIGFKLVPLGKDGKPVMSWTPIYDNPEYWTPDKLVQDASKFSNGVATVFGKTSIKDEKGPLYLYALDIDSDEVYKTLFRLQNPKRGQEYSFIVAMQERSVVVKTRKPNGFHIYWLSHKEHKSILTMDCKVGFEFEIKSGKDSGHSTLPPSRHREDSDFHYKNYGQQKLFVSDDMYDRLIEALTHCLKPKRSGDHRETNKQKCYADGEKGELDDADIQVTAECIRPYYKKGHRHTIVFGLSGLLHKSGVSKDSAIALIETLAKDDKESDVRNAVSTVEETFEKDANVVAGSRYLLDALVAAIEDSGIAKGILEKIFRIIGKGNLIQWLTQVIMKEYTFKTATDNEDIYCYDKEKGVYMASQEWRIKDLSQLIFPEIKTHDLHEVINQIKRRTYIDRSCFDSNIDILNLQNGLLNLHTLEFTKHSPDCLSLVQFPIKYVPNAKCPNVLKFLGQVLKPKDVFTALQLCGYCLYKSAKYEKAVMCVGKGDNGKSTFLKLIERLLGVKNVSHVSLQELNGDKFAFADLCGKLANIFADLKSEKCYHLKNWRF